MTFGFIGLFRKLCTRENKAIRYVSDSSYWLYGAHVPLIIGTQLTVRDWPLFFWDKVLPSIYRSHRPSVADLPIPYPLHLAGPIAERSRVRPTN